MKRKPLGYRRLINHCKENYKFCILPTLEADDAIGIDATRFADPENIVVSPDKDMKQIPGRLYNMDEMFTITPEQGEQWHYIQTLAGDQTDGYSGVPGIGIKRAVALFEEHGYTWDTVVKAFADKDLDEDVALMNARLAKILTNKEYDGQVIPWCPPNAGD